VHDLAAGVGEVELVVGEYDILFAHRVDEIRDAVGRATLDLSPALTLVGVRLPLYVRGIDVTALSSGVVDGLVKAADMAARALLPWTQSSGNETLFPSANRVGICDRREDQRQPQERDAGCDAYRWPNWKAQTTLAGELNGSDYGLLSFAHFLFPSDVGRDARVPKRQELP
jgi:hypothetical protein